jgi:hypothetical protein
MMMVLGPHTARGNIPQAIEHSVQFQTGILRFMREHNFARVETRPEQVDDWTQTVIKAAEPLLSSKVDSWQTGVNRNVDGRQLRRPSPRFRGRSSSHKPTRGQQTYKRTTDLRDAQHD